MADIEFHPEARAEYRHEIVWYHRRSSKASVRFEAEVERVVQLVAADPESFPRFDDDHRFAVLRRYPFSIVFRSEADRVYVVAVAHASREEGYWLNRG